MKKIYFVRHGETAFNIENKEQGIEGSLNDHGRKQAAFVAKRFRTIPIDKIVASPYPRTKETAEIIAAELNKEITYCDFLVERKPPSRFIGGPTDDPEYRKALKLMTEKRMVDPNWRYADEDTFTELKERAEAALEYLKSLPEESILAVSHAGILRVIIGSVIFGKELMYKEYVKIFRTFQLSNTGITLIEYETASKKGHTGWKIIAWNDHAHLG